MTWLLLSLVLIVAHSVETTTGFGCTVIALALGVHLYPIEELIVVLVMIALLQSSWLVVRGFYTIDWRLLSTRILPACAVGLPAGAYLFHDLSGRHLKVILGIFIVIISSAELYRLYRRQESSRPLPPGRGTALLVLGGFFHGIFASGGPLVVYYSSRRIGEKASFRSTLSTLWLLLNTTLLVTYLIYGPLEHSHVMLTAKLLPALLVGIIIGEMLHRWVNEITFRKVVQSVLLFTGVSLLT
ncbi:MAG: sulfite exporter TauE/SafE family protein [Deltaproteobacteria bacterium]|nr:MAG: sulfite exporter TauE/SafE family protein [Deltaproteobacteria bacterium]